MYIHTYVYVYVYIYTYIHIYTSNLDSAAGRSRRCVGRRSSQAGFWRGGPLDPRCAVMNRIIIRFGVFRVLGSRVQGLVGVQGFRVQGLRVFQGLGIVTIVLQYWHQYQYQYQDSRCVLVSGFVLEIELGCNLGSGYS